MISRFQQKLTQELENSFRNLTKTKIKTNKKYTRTKGTRCVKTAVSTAKEKKMQ